jgi:hypothetical protein
MTKGRPNFEIEKECVSCGNLFHGEFCNTCGQKVIQRFTGIYLWQRLREDVIGIESGLFYTFRELWVNPGKMILNYVRGATKPYYSPLKYLILWTAVYLISLAFISKTEQHPEFLQELIFNSTRPFSFESLTEGKLFIGWFMQHQTNFYLIGIIPFLSLSGYIFFRSKKFNLTEIAIFYTYFCGQFAFCALIANLLNLVPAWKETELSTLIIFVLYVYLFFRMQTQFFSERLGISILKGIGILSCGIVMYWSFLFASLNGIKFLIQLSA